MFFSSTTITKENCRQEVASFALRIEQMEEEDKIGVRGQRARNFSGQGSGRAWENSFLSLSNWKGKHWECKTREKMLKFFCFAIRWTLLGIFWRVAIKFFSAGLTKRGASLYSSHILNINLTTLSSSHLHLHTNFMWSMSFCLSLQPWCLYN